MEILETMQEEIQEEIFDSEINQAKIKSSLFYCVPKRDGMLIWQ